MDAAAALTEDEVRTALASLGERLRSLHGLTLRRLVLYGSRARGDADPDSDVDVAIIVVDAGPRERDRIIVAVAFGQPLSSRGSQDSLEAIYDQGEAEIEIGILVIAMPR